VVRGQTVAVFAGNTANPTTAPYGSTLALQVSRGPPPIPVPDVTNQPGTTAVNMLRHAGFVVSVTAQFSTTVHAGNVITTKPAPNAPLQPGATVMVYVSEGAPVTIPLLGRMTFNAAEVALINAGLSVSSTPQPPGTHLWRTVPAAGTQVKKGTTVVLYLK
jgi:serine/threonine-protein kinase